MVYFEPGQHVLSSAGKAQIMVRSTSFTSIPRSGLVQHILGRRLPFEVFGSFIQSICLDGIKGKIIAFSANFDIIPYYH